MFKDSAIYIAGHTGLLGSAITKLLTNQGYSNLITAKHKKLDLTVRQDIFDFFEKNKPEYVFLAAGKVGGIVDNKTYPADYFNINIAIQTNTFEAAQKFGVKHLVFYGSSCTYPKVATQPMNETQLLTGQLEETSIGYAAAKIAGILACRAYNHQYKTNRFICLIPNSGYGPNDNFNPASSHVLSALMRKFHDAKMANAENVVLWGNGTTKREFIHSRDIAEASVFAVQNADSLKNFHYNIGSGVDCSIKDLAEMMSEIIGFQGRIDWDICKPSGTKQKLLDSGQFKSLGWQPKFDLHQGLQETYEWFCKNIAD